MADDCNHWRTEWSSSKYIGSITCFINTAVFTTSQLKKCANTNHISLHCKGSDLSTKLHLQIFFFATTWGQQHSKHNLLAPSWLLIFLQRSKSNIHPSSNAVVCLPTLERNIWLFSNFTSLLFGSVSSSWWDYVNASNQKTLENMGVRYCNCAEA